MKPSVLSRYVTGRVIPTHSRADELIKTLSASFGVAPLILESIVVDDSNMVDDTKLLSSPTLLRLAAIEARSALSQTRASKVVTMASDGIAYATMLAELMGVDVVVAKKEREKGVKHFLYAEAKIGDSGLSVGAYAPKHSFRRGDTCLIVDDLVRTGETQEALSKLVTKAGGVIVGYCFLVSVGSKWRGLLERGVKVHVSVSI